MREAELLWVIEQDIYVESGLYTIVGGAGGSEILWSNLEEQRSHQPVNLRSQVWIYPIYKSG